uniref:Putative salivary lipocalin n=1 Tax=Ixodes ricinus TaxID=34613 RepID=A0A147BW57_IXORI
MLQNIGYLFTGLLLIINAASTDPGSDEKSKCQNVSVPAGFTNIPSSEQDAWSFVAAAGDFMYVLFRNFHSDSENKGTNMCVMVQKVPYNERGETKFANYTKWFNGTTWETHAMRSFYKYVKFDGSKGTTNNVLVARHKIGGDFTPEFCYPFVFTDAKCAVVLMNHWNHAAQTQCENSAATDKHESGDSALKSDVKMPCQTACELWVRHENLNETSLSTDCTKYYTQFCGNKKIFLYNKTICDEVERFPINITESISKDQ